MSDIGEGSVTNSYDDMLKEFAKKSLLDIVTVMNDFVKLMIPLTTGVITVYFALLKFLGIEKVPYGQGFYFIEPTIFLFLSLVVFVISCFPVPRKLSMGTRESIIKYRKSSMIWKYICICIASGLFLIGIALMMAIMVNNIYEPN